MHNKFLVSSAIVLSLVATRANAADIDEQIKQMQDQINALQQQVHALKQQQKTPAPAAVAGDVKITMTPSPKIESTDGKFSFQPFGRIQLDAGFIDDDKVDHSNGANFRRARLGFKGNVAEDWEYKFELDFAKEDLAFKDVFIAYKGFDPVELVAGHTKPQFGLEELTSSNYITFIERSSPITTFVTSQQIGLQANSGGDNWSAGVGLYNDDAGVVSTDDEAWSVVGRATYAPIVEKDKVIHLGVASTYRTPDQAADEVRFRTKAENDIASLRSIDTGTIAGADSTTLYGLEAAAVWNQFSLQGEYINATVETETGSDPDLNGWYVFGSWLLTGESRPYTAKTGTFGRIKPNNPFSLKEGGLGALELALRYSNTDLNDGVVTGGEMKNYTVGLNWYTTNNTRLMFNFISVNTDQNGVTADDDPNIFLVRAQVDF